MKNFIKKLIGSKFLLAYHYLLAYSASLWYGFPARKLIVIGITGTKGKTSSAEMTHAVLLEGGLKTGLIGTAHFKIGDQIILNKLHMTMPPPLILQKMLRKMVKSKCTHVVMEVSSEGIKQSRHIGIDYDIAVFTNLSPEHLPAHNNSFLEYKKTKGFLFDSLKRSFRKKFFNRKIIITNSDSEHASYYSSFWADAKISYGLESGDLHPESFELRNSESSFTIQKTEFIIHIPGIFNILNALVAFSVAQSCGLSIDIIKKGIESVSIIPGRMEKIDEGQAFDVFVDYAHEKLSMTMLLQTAQQIKKPQGKVIVLFGAQGGGRDKNKRKEMGEVAGRIADYVILTSDDSYEEKPESIISDIAAHVRKEGKLDNQNMFLIVDRKEAIQKAFNIAEVHDIVLIAGKGAETTMITNHGTVPWDERKIVRDLLRLHSVNK